MARIMGEIGIHFKSSIIAMFNSVLKPCNIGCAQTQLTWSVEHFYPGILVVYLVGEFSQLPDVLVETPEVEALTRTVQNQFSRVVELVPTLPDELQLAAANVNDQYIRLWHIRKDLFKQGTQILNFVIRRCNK